MPRKVFELAKELDIGAIELVDKLKNAGFNIRNHMALLSIEDVEKAKELFGAKKSSSSVTKKKKTLKRKVKKKTDKEKQELASNVEDIQGTKESSSKVKLKRKTVVRKKASSTVNTEEEIKSIDKIDIDNNESNNETLSASDIEKHNLTNNILSEEDKKLEQTNLNIDNSSDDVEKTKTKIKTKTKVKIKTGLNIVSVPSKKNKTNAEHQNSADATNKKTTAIATSTSGDVEDMEKEDSQKSTIKTDKTIKLENKTTSTKSTGLRIVTMPKKVEEENKSNKKSDSSSGSPSDTTTGDTAKNKKRLGGLASMMSGKKVTRSLAIQQTRADSELKSYAALSGAGKPIYSQVKRKRIYNGPSSRTQITETKESKRCIKLHGGGLVSEIAKKLHVKLKDFRDKCLEIDLLVKHEDFIGIKLARIIAEMYSYRVEDIKFNETHIISKQVKKDEHLEAKNPVVTIMGHVDHGKTTLLDYIRQAKVCPSEAGGITQHVGAYQVDVGDKSITFLDTPGHAAFASMRERGANLTDLVILVVASDDGVMPQTKESIKYIKSAGVPMLVAINKMDKESANPDRVKQELTELEVTPEDWGGDTIMQPISALKGDGVDQLLESVLLLAEMNELTANSKSKAEGIVIESKIEAGRGPVSTVLIKTGTIKKGDSIVVGECYGRARNLLNHLGETLNSAGPSVPVQILGVNSVAKPGDVLNVVKNEREARKIAENRIHQRVLLESTEKPKKMSLEDFFSSTDMNENEVEEQTLHLIIRADVQGSFEAIKDSLLAYSTNNVKINILTGGVGAITDSDINLASTAHAIVIGFNMRPVTSARRLSENLGVEIRTYSIIYKLIDDVKLAIEGMLIPDKKEKYIGRAEVKEVFTVPKLGSVGGLVVIDGLFKIGCNIRLLRNEKILYDGELSSLKRFKDNVKEVKSGYECGAGLKDYDDIKVDDIFEAYEFEEIKKSLDDVLKLEANIETFVKP